MPVLVFDVETTTKLKGHPFCPDNKLVMAGFMLDGNYVETLDPKVIHDLFNQATVIVGFNIKFDLHWVRREFGIMVHDKQIWDCQLAHFLLTCQQGKYPSLNESCAHNGLGQKIDVIKTEYWDKGIDTDQIPKDVLSEYLRQDILLTSELYVKQKSQGKNKLIQLSCWDTLCLAEMEWNGFQYDIDGSRQEGDKLQTEIDKIGVELNKLVGFEPNWNSRDQLSAILYGGEIKTKYVEEYLFQYKNAKRAPVLKQRILEHVRTMPTLVKPSKETSKAGVYVVDEGTLSRLKCKGKAAKIIELILKRSKMNKLVGTYLHGIPNTAEERGWGNVLHGQLNQCVAVTSRLSSNKPNLQNCDPGVKRYFVSRFD